MSILSGANFDYKIPQYTNLFYFCSLIFKPLDLLISPKFYTLSSQQLTEMIVLLKYVFDIGSVIYLECLFPWAFQLREPSMNSYFGKYLSGQICLPHCPHCLSLFIQLKSCACLLYSQA